VVVSFSKQLYRPFDLVAYNVTLYKNNNQDHITTGLRDKTLGPDAQPTVIGTSSILTPYTGTSGNPWEYSYVGNFNLDGSFALVESTNYYTGKMTVKAPIGSVFISSSTPSGGETLTAVTATDAVGGDYNEIQNPQTTKDKVATPDSVAVAVIQDAGVVIDSGGSVYPAPSYALPLPPATNTGVGATLTNLQVLEYADKNIKVYLPGKLASILNNMITF
jgi:hypothetical protein